MNVNAESIDWQTVQLAGLMWPIKTICYGALVGPAQAERGGHFSGALEVAVNTSAD
jgi:hypothetical protein